MKKGTQKTRNALVASAVALTLCCALLLGTTFAWFTDSVTNKGNVITAGNLSIDATAYSVNKDAEDADKKYQIDGVNGDQEFAFAMEDGKNLKDEDCPAIITENPWEPGISDAKLITVTNKGNLAAKIQLRFTTSNGVAEGVTLNPDQEGAKLQDALWFDFVQVNTDTGKTLGQFEKKPMSQLQAVADKMTVPLDAGKSVSFILVYGMDEAAGNEYQNLTFSADVTVLATQAAVEADGFGSNQYDADATYHQAEVTLPGDGTSAADNGEALADAIANAEDNTTLVLPAATYKVDQNLVLGDKKIALVGQKGTILEPGTSGDAGAITVQGADGASLTVENITVTGDANKTGRGICFSGQGNANVTLTVKNSTFTSLNTGIYLGGVTNASISGCTFSGCNAGIGGTEALSGTLTVSDSTFESTDETIGWAGTGKLVISGCPTCESFNRYLNGQKTTMTVTDGSYSD